MKVRFGVMAGVGVGSSVAVLPSVASADWTPLITSAAFTGIQTDLGTVATGITTVLLIVLGIGILWKVFT